MGSCRGAAGRAGSHRSEKGQFHCGQFRKPPEATSKRYRTCDTDPAVSGTGGRPIERLRPFYFSRPDDAVSKHAPGGPGSGGEGSRPIDRCRPDVRHRPLSHERSPSRPNSISSSGRRSNDPVYMSRKIRKFRTDKFDT